MSKTYEVRVVSTQKKYSREFQVKNEFEDGWKSVLQRAHGTPVVCLCPGKGNRYLSVKHREGTTTITLPGTPTPVRSMQTTADSMLTPQSDQACRATLREL
ncbi:hypothetical protein BHE76_25335 [Pseudomonas aeruginosa]|nr:hypothetical protein BHE76_25335 [Pseudomonas aeruginosa]